MKRLIPPLLATVLSATPLAPAIGQSGAQPTASPHEAVAALLRAGKAQEALTRAEALLVAKPHDLQARFGKALALADLGRAQEAIDTLEGLTQDFPELPEPHNNLGVVLASQGRYEQAVLSFKRAISAAPNYVTAQENLGDLYIAMAAHAYTKGLALKSDDPMLKRKLDLTRSLQTQLRSAP